MMAVPRRSERAAEQPSAESTETALVPIEQAPLPNASGPELKPDPGLYAVLGLDPSVSDGQIQTTYRRLAAKLLGNGSNDIQALKQLNAAYEVLGNPVRRVDYDRLRLSYGLS